MFLQQLPDTRICFDWALPLISKTAAERENALQKLV